jgi:hypothetical protein
MIAPMAMRIAIEGAPDRLGAVAMRNSQHLAWRPVTR